MSKKYDIFISYRRDTGAQYARILQLMLSQRGYRVFLDYDELKDGVFSEKIEEAIREAPVFVLVLSAHALDRCANEGDWVRREIQLAISLGKHIVPVNPDNTFTGVPENIPEDIRLSVSSHQHSEIGFGQILGVTIDQMIRFRLQPSLGERSASGAVDTDVESARRTLARIDARNRFLKRVAVVTSVLVLAVVLAVAFYIYKAIQHDKEQEAWKERLSQVEQTYKEPFLLNLSPDITPEQLDAVEEILSRMVRVNDTLYISKFEFTEGEWHGILGGEYSEDRRDYPAVSHNYGDVYLNLVDSLRSLTSVEFDLPTADEWMLAARGGDCPDGTLYSGSDNVDEVAWYSGNSEGRLHESNGQQGKGPNNLDLYDMSGNASEMCYSFYEVTACGGDYTSPDTAVTVSSMSKYDINEERKTLGFRLIIRVLNP